MITSDRSLLLSSPLRYSHSLSLPIQKRKSGERGTKAREIQIERGMSTAAEGYAGGGGEQVFLLPHHNHQGAVDGDFFCHVPQHSRREKLRFPADDSLAAAAPSLPLFYQTNTAAAAGLANFLPSSYYNVHEVDGAGAIHQIHRQGFSLSLSPAEFSPLGPFTGYAAVLNRSGFVEPARQLLEEICQFGRGNFSGYREPPEAFMLDGEPDKLAGAEGQPWKKIKLASMLDEVQRKQRICYQQVEAVRAAFEAVAGLNTAAPFVSMALKTMSRSFKSLKNAISGHLDHLEKDSGKEFGKREIPGYGRVAAGDQACLERRNYGPITFGQQPNAWRPQRGLPERAVAVLRAWLFEHFLHPYPTDTDKQILAKQTGLSRNQVSNWFINARVRLWKPMVEEIHNLELHQLQKSGAADDNNNNNNNNVRNSGFQTLQPSSSAAAAYSSGRPPESIDLQRNSSAGLPHIEEPYSFALNDFAGHGQALGGSSLVSLTLGLHQNNGAVCLPEAMSMNVARRLGLEECGNAYILCAFEGQEMRQYGKEIGGLLLHDFVG